MYSQPNVTVDQRLTNAKEECGQHRVTRNNRERLLGQQDHRIGIIAYPHNLELSIGFEPLESRAKG